MTSYRFQIGDRVICLKTDDIPGTIMAIQSDLYGIIWDNHDEYFRGNPMKLDYISDTDLNLYESAMDKLDEIL